jgi:hypothetical protein
MALMLQLVSLFFVFLHKLIIEEIDNDNGQIDRKEEADEKKVIENIGSGCPHNSNFVFVNVWHQ